MTFGFNYKLDLKKRTRSGGFDKPQ